MKEDKKGDGGTWAVRTAEGVSGAVAGIMSTFLGHPFEILKVRVQVRQDIVRASWPTWNMTKELARLDRPLIHFYRGITANAVGSGFAWALFWPIKNAAENAIRSWKATPASSEKVPLSFLDTFLAVAIANVGIQVVSNPIWVVKTRMLALERGAAGAYPNTLAAFVSIFRTEGPKTFYSGFAISQVATIQTGLQFIIYDHTKAWAMQRRRQANNNAEGSDADTQPALEIAAISSVAKALSITALYPYQVVRSRVQMPDAKARYGDGIAAVTRSLYGEGKFRAFYKGLGPAIARTLPATCVTFLAYEKLCPKLTEVLGGKKGGDQRTP